MKYVAFLLTAGLLLAGCGEKTTPAGGSGAEGGAPVAGTPGADTQVVEIVPEKNIGDIEAELTRELTLDADAAPAGVTADELRSQFKKLTLLTVNVDGPRPAELWFKIDFDTQLEFPERPVAVRGRLVREVVEGQKETIFDFKTVLDGNASQRKRRVEGNYPPFHFRAEILHGLTELPDTMLVYGELDVVIMPEGTDPATLDPDTAHGATDDEGTLLTNPVRVNFHISEAPAPAPAVDPVPAPAPEAAAAPAAETPAPDAAAPEAPAAEAAPEAPAADAAPVEAPPVETPAPQESGGAGS